MRRRPKDPLPHLPPVIEVDSAGFTRREVAEMFGGIDPSIISKDCIAIGITPYEPLFKKDIWRLYVLACYKRLYPYASRNSFVRLCKDKGDAAALALVHIAGGSREDCDDLIDRFIAKKQTKPLLV